MRKDYFLGLSEEGFHKIAYTEWGQENNKYNPIICVHGLTRNSRDFDSLANFLSLRDQHVYCPDVVGRGDSDWLKNPHHYTYEQYLADMNVLLARTQAKQVNWIGTSMGGTMGMILAAQQHSPIERLILNDVGAQIPAQALGRLSKYVGQDPDFTSFEAAKKYFKIIYAGFGNLTEVQWDHLTEFSIIKTAEGKFVSKLDPAVKSSQSKSKIAWSILLNPHKILEGSFLDIDLWEMWRKIKCPVLIIHGSRSDLLLPSIIEKMRHNNPQVEVFEVPDAGHAPALMEISQQEAIFNWLQK